MSRSDTKKNVFFLDDIFEISLLYYLHMSCIILQAFPLLPLSSHCFRILPPNVVPAAGPRFSCPKVRFQLLQRAAASSVCVCVRACAYVCAFLS